MALNFASVVSSFQILGSLALGGTQNSPSNWYIFPVLSITSGLFEIHCLLLPLSVRELHNHPIWSRSRSLHDRCSYLSPWKVCGSVDPCGRLAESEKKLKLHSGCVTMDCGTCIKHSSLEENTIRLICYPLPWIQFSCSLWQSLRKWKLNSDEDTF